jgi:hypothetical protein
MKEASHLHENGIINDQQLNAINEYERTKPMSIHWELRTILYLGVLLFVSGIGMLVYLNIDTIGHQAILSLILLSCAACFYYGYKNRQDYSHGQVKYDSPFFDYIILLGCILFGIFIGYFQYQYSVFGYHYGIAILIPTAVFFICAYYFDHKGVLSLFISGLAGWAGLSVTPLQLLEENNFSDTHIIFSAIALGLTIVAFAMYSDRKNIKKHFGFSYNNFAINILCVAALAALFDLSWKPMSFLFLAAICYYYIKYALAEQSFLFLMLSVIYGYIGVTYVCFNSFEFDGELSILLGTFYVMLSCAGIVWFFVNYKRMLGIKK